MFTKLCSEARETFENSVYPLDFKQCKQQISRDHNLLKENFLETYIHYCLCQTSISGLELSWGCTGRSERN